MNRKPLILILFVMFCLTLGACTHNRTGNTLVGAGAGGLGGGLVGGAIGGTTGAIIGGTAGAVGGAYVGNKHGT
jgi:hypothetical protein